MKGVLILKPDFFTKDNFKKLIEIIKREKLAYVGAYLIHNYHKFCKSYREFDIANAIENKDDRSVSYSSLCIKCGNDITMPGSKEDCDDIKNALLKGDISLEDIEKCAQRIIEAIIRVNN